MNDRESDSEGGFVREFDAKQARKDHPTGWMHLTRYPTTRFIIDTVLESGPSHEFNKSELSRRTGMTRDSIREHLPKLIELGVIEEIDDGGWAEYQLNEQGRVTQALFNLNNAVNAVLAGQSKNMPQHPEIRIDQIDRSEWQSVKRFQEQISQSEQEVET